MSVGRVVAGMVLLDGAALFGAGLAAVAALSRTKTKPLDRRPWAAAAVVALTALGVAMGLGLLKTAHPAIHDEFAYLLEADTFAHGRLANPPPPLPEHFETFHVLVTPTYASKYQPAQGIALATGLVLFGNASAGAWLAFAAACAAVFWFLRATVAPRFALAGALLCALFPTFHDDGIAAWTQTFWGGQMPMLGGALLFGAAARLSKRVRAIDGLALGAGLSILAMSRPFEGLLAAVFAGIGALRTWRLGRLPEGVMKRAVPWAAAALVPAMAFLLYFNFRVTENALVMPVQKYESQYAACPVAIWLPQPAPKTYSSPDLKAFYDGTLACWNYLRTPRGQFDSDVFRSGQVIRYYWKPLSFIWIGLALALVRRRTQRLLFAVLAAAAVSMTMTWLNMHYLAPFVPLGVELAARSLKPLAALERPWKLGGRAAILIALGILSARLVEDGIVFALSNKPEVWPALHAELARRASADGSRALIVVERRDGWSPDQEWVYNGAELEEQKVIWARSLDAKRDRELIDHFRDRVPWRLLLDRNGWHLDRWEAPPK